ncbi:hypothetical protein L6304_05870 [bacterium]|nr:hypothetical protein [bacterium]MBU4310176.1 hypothetical protein [bacterium]MCG2676682.1 hypothetical protein [bacterium]
MIAFLIVGILSLILALLYFTVPDLVIKINNALKRVLFEDRWTFNHRLRAASFFLIGAIILLWAWWATKGPR